MKHFLFTLLCVLFGSIVVFNTFAQRQYLLPKKPTTPYAVYEPLEDPRSPKVPVVIVYGVAITTQVVNYEVRHVAKNLKLEVAQDKYGSYIYRYTTDGLYWKRVYEKKYFKKVPFGDVAFDYASYKVYVNGLGDVYIR